MIMRTQNKQNSHMLLMGINKNGTATLERVAESWKQLSDLITPPPLWKTVCQFLIRWNIFTMWTSILTLRYLFKRKENLHSHNNLYINVYSVLIHDHRNRSNPNVLELVNGLTNCGISIQWKSALKMNKLLIQQCAWISNRLW